MPPAWWRPLQDEPRLSQGDVLIEVTFGALVRPRLPLEKQTIKGGGIAWKEIEWKPDANGYCHCLARARITAALVLTHSCQLDKPGRSRRLIVAPVSPASQLPTDIREVVFAGQHLALIAMPDVPQLGDCYVDLRLMTAMDRDAIDEKAMRAATMTTDGVADLQTRIWGFFSREDGPGPRAASAT